MLTGWIALLLVRYKPLHRHEYPKTSPLTFHYITIVWWFFSMLDRIEPLNTSQFMKICWGWGWFANTLWLFNIAMENNPFIDGLPTNSMVIFHGYVSHNQRVLQKEPPKSPKRIVVSPIKASGPPTVVYTAQTASAPWPPMGTCGRCQGPLESTIGTWWFNQQTRVTRGFHMIWWDLQLIDES